MSALKLQCLNSSGSQIFSINEVSGVLSTTTVNFNNTTNSVNSSTGSLVINGGLGIIKDVYVGSSIVTPNLNSLNVTTSNLNSLNVTTSNLNSLNLASINTTVTNLISTNISSGILNINTIYVSGNVTIGGNLVVVGSTTIVNLTTSNQLETNVTAASILITGGSLNATFNTNTLGNLFTINGNVGINTTFPNYTLDVNGNIGVSGNSLNLNNTVSNTIIYNLIGVNPPTFTSRSIGTKIVLSPGITSTNLDYAIGIENSSMWMSSQQNFKWYINLTSASMLLNQNGLQLNNTGISSYNITNNSNGNSLDLALAFTSGNYSTSALPGDTVLRTSFSHNLILQSGSGGSNILINSAGNVGINNTSPTFTLDVNGTSRITGNLTTGAVYSTNATITNIVSTFITSSSALLTNVSISNLNTLNISTTNFTTSNSNVTNSSIQNLNVLNVSTANFTTSNSNVTNSSISNLNALNVATTNFTTSNSNVTNSSIQNLNTLNASITNFTTSSSNVTNSSIQNLNTNKITTTSLIITGGSLNATFNSNTLGNLFTTGGNIGINTSVPQFALDIRNTSANVQLNLQTTLSQLQFFSTNTSNINYIQSSGDINFTAIGSASVRTLYLATSGNVGIGNITPNYTLDINGNVGISGSSLNLNNTVSNTILYNPVGVNSPTFTTRSIGTKIVLYPLISSTTLDMALGVENGNNIWFSAPNGFKWYTNNTLASMILTSTGLQLNNGINSSYNITNNSNGSSLDLALAFTSGNYSTSALPGDTVLRTSLGHNLILQSGSSGSNILINSAGNVGINTNTPQNALDVVGQIRTLNLTPLVGQNDMIRFGQTESNFNMALIDYNYTTVGSSSNSIGLGFFGANNKLVILANGNIGINNIAPNFTLDVNGTSRITGNLTTGAVYSTNATITNAFITTLSTGTLISSNLLSTNTSLSSVISNNITTGTLFSTTITTSSIYTTFVTSSNIFTTNISSLNNTISNLFSSNTTVNNLNVINITSGILNVTGITSQNINFTGSLYQNGSLYISSQWTTFGTNGNLAYTAGNVGINTTSPNYTLDVNGITRINNTTLSTSNTLGALIVSGGISVVSTNSSSNSVGGGLTISGGAAISQDMYIGGNLFIQGINNSAISGSKLLTSNSSTGTFQVPINISRTLLNNTYKIIGNTSTISSNTAVFSVSFNSLTTTSFIANVYRIDALGSSWALTDLTLNYTIYP